MKSLLLLLTCLCYFSANAQEGESKPAIVIHLEDDWVYAGFAGDDAPRTVFPCIVGKPRQPRSSTSESKDVFVGDDALMKRGLLTLSSPIEKGMIINFDDIEKVLHHTFHNELRVNPSEQAVIITETPFTSKENREKLTQIMFDKLNVPALYISNSAVSSLYSGALTTGVAVELSSGIAHIVPVHEGAPIPEATIKFSIGQKDNIEYFNKLLTERGYSFYTSAEQEIVKDIYRSLSMVSLEYEADIEKSKQTNEFDRNYELPDGMIITVGAERFRSTEILFKPSMINLDMEGIDKLTHQAIMKCNEDLRKELYNNIVLSGTNSTSEGTEARLTKEIEALSPEFTRVRILCSPERKYYSWFGASVLSSLSTFEQICVTKTEYKEAGPSIIHQKCF